MIQIVCKCFLLYHFLLFSSSFAHNKTLNVQFYILMFDFLSSLGPC